jgi:quinoprotein glucose dehydrogenase
MRSNWMTRAAVSMACAIPLVILARAQAPARQAAGTDWPMYRGDTSGTGYSPLSQITPGNVASLQTAWSYSLEGEPPADPKRGVNSQATPIVVNGVMYVPAANRVVALDARTGKELWRHMVTGGGAPSRRGVSYWPGGEGRGPRIVFSVGKRIIALDAKSGTPVPSFGVGGEIDIEIPYNSVPFIYRNTVIVGANTPPGTFGGVGNARAFDARTGAKLWEFSSVPQPGSIGHETWDGDSWKGRLGANAWPFYFTMDEVRGLLFIPLASPIGGFFGGDRKGANLFGNSLVAVDIRTGAYKWHFQTIHHDLWDHDPPAPPVLFDARQGGRTIPAVGITTKSGYLYILNRENGQPIFGVEERPVPKSDVPGEQSFPTQPFPVKPLPLARNTYTAADLVTAADTSAEHAQACSEFVARIGGVHNAGPFTPWRLRAEGAQPAPTLIFPGILGGANWGGVAVDPRSGYLFVVTQDVGMLGWVEKTKEGSVLPYQRTTPGRGTFDVQMGDVAWPCQKPPWGRLTAVNSSTGDIAWQIPLGITEQLPAGKQNTGRPALAGAIATAGGLLFIGSTDDNRFRALDAANGTELWSTRLQRRGNANPITYQAANGKQYVALVATDTLVVYTLP